MEASYRGRLDLVQNLLSKMFSAEADKLASVNINQKDAWGYTALMYAAREGHLAVVQALIENGSLVNAQNAAGDTALIWAAARVQVSVLKLLIERGADAAIRNNVIEIL